MIWTIEYNHNVTPLYTRRKQQLLCMMYDRSKNCDILLLDGTAQIPCSNKATQLKLDNIKLSPALPGFKIVHYTGA